jgi:hypothetical protein
VFKCTVMIAAKLCFAMHLCVNSIGERLIFRPTSDSNYIPCFKCFFNLMLCALCCNGGIACFVATSVPKL